MNDTWSTSKAADRLSGLPDLTAEDMAEALRYAAEAVGERELLVRRPA